LQDQSPLAAALDRKSTALLSLLLNDKRFKIPQNSKVLYKLLEIYNRKLYFPIVDALKLDRDIAITLEEENALRKIIERFLLRKDLNTFGLEREDESTAFLSIGCYDLGLLRKILLHPNTTLTESFPYDHIVKRATYLKNELLTLKEIDALYIQETLFDIIRSDKNENLWIFDCHFSRIMQKTSFFSNYKTLKENMCVVRYFIKLCEYAEKIPSIWKARIFISQAQTVLLANDITKARELFQKAAKLDRALLDLYVKQVAVTFKDSYNFAVASQKTDASSTSTSTQTTQQTHYLSVLLRLPEILETDNAQQLFLIGQQFEFNPQITQDIVFAMALYQEALARSSGKEKETMIGCMRYTENIVSSFQEQSAALQNAKATLTSYLNNIVSKKPSVFEKPFSKNINNILELLRPENIHNETTRNALLKHYLYLVSNNAGAQFTGLLKNLIIFISMNLSLKEEAQTTQVLQKS
jgi:hypothetical protein